MRGVKERVAVFVDEAGLLLNVGAGDEGRCEGLGEECASQEYGASLSGGRSRSMRTAGATSVSSPLKCTRMP